MHVMSNFTRDFYSSPLRFDRLYDQCSAPLFLYNSANRWIGIRLELIAICITMVTAILIVVLRDRISPAYAGLALSYTVQVCHHEIVYK